MRIQSEIFDSILRGAGRVRPGTGRTISASRGPLSFSTPSNATLRINSRGHIYDMIVDPYDPMEIARLQNQGNVATAKIKKAISMPLIISGNGIVVDNARYRSLPTFYEKAEPYRDELWQLVREVRDNPSETAYLNLEDLLTEIRTGTRIGEYYKYIPNRKLPEVTRPNGFDLFLGIPTDVEVYANPALKDQYLNLMLLKNNMAYLPVPTNDMIVSAFRNRPELANLLASDTMFSNSGLDYFLGDENQVIHLNVLPQGTMDNRAIAANNAIMDSLPTGTTLSASNEDYPIHYLRARGEIDNNLLRDFIIHGKAPVNISEFHPRVYSTNIARILGTVSSLPHQIHTKALNATTGGFNTIGHTVNMRDKIHTLPGGLQYYGKEIVADRGFRNRFEIIPTYVKDSAGNLFLDINGDPIISSAKAYNKQIVPFITGISGVDLPTIARMGNAEAYNKSFGNAYHAPITFDQSGQLLLPYTNITTILRKGGKTNKLISYKNFDYGTYNKFGKDA